MKNYKTQIFEDFLQDKHFEENSMIPDDDLSDAFYDWYSELYNFELVNYADEFADKQVREFSRLITEHGKKKAMTLFFNL